jgi:hypothetical protein
MYNMRVAVNYTPLAYVWVEEPRSPVESECFFQQAVFLLLKVPNRRLDTVARVLQPGVKELAAVSPGNDLNQNPCIRQRVASASMKPHG